MTHSVSKMERFVKRVETIGNKLPHPWLLFLLLTALLLMIAHVLNGVVFQVPGEETTGEIVTLLNAGGLRYMFANAMKNFAGFPPIALVIPIAIAVGVGEQAGLFRAVIVKTVRSVPHSLITAAFIFVAINSNFASDARYPIMMAIGATLFAGMGRSPLLGIVIGYATAGAALSANILIAGTDATAAGITAQAAQFLSITTDAAVHPAINWYFMAASAFVLTAVGTYVTEKVIAPMFDDVEYDQSQLDQDSVVIAKDESRGLKYAGIATLIFIIGLLAVSAPSGALLRDPETNLILPKSPFMSSIVLIVFAFFLVTAIAYGVGARTIKSSWDVGRFMAKGVSNMSSFLVLCFFAAQFTDYFSKTGLSTYIAVSGATFFEAIGLTGVPLLLLIILVVAIMNLTIGSAAAKWAMLAPVIVPMLALLGFTPAFSQLVYRIGDSATNPINPLSTSLPLLIAYLQQYKRDAGLGTAIAYSIPLVLAFLGSWTLLMIIWYVLKLPIGLGANILL